MSQKYSIDEFVNIIKSLCLGQYIWLHQRYSTKDTEYVQLSSRVSNAYHKLKLSVRSEAFKFLTPHKELENFIFLLANSAKSNHWHYPNAEKAHAEYLIGFLLQQKLIIEHQGKKYNLNNMIKNSLPRMEREYEPRAYYFYQQHLVPPTCIDFWSQSWREAQNYPSMKDLQDIWTQYVNEKQKKKAQREQVAKQQALKEQQEQQAYARWRDIHTFDNNVLDYKSFSFVLEGIVKCGNVNLHDNSTFGYRMQLSVTLSQQLLYFSQQVRNVSFISNEKYMKLAFEFEQLMRGLIYSSKYDRSENGDAARQLVGFLLFHNFCIQHGTNQINMRNIFWREANDEEKYHIANGPECHPWRFLDVEWLQNQNYPGKLDLKKILSTKESLHMIDDFHENNVFLNAFHHQAIKPWFADQQSNQFLSAQENNGLYRRQSF